MDHQPLVSIIMNCYNGQTYLDEALKSVVNQTYKNWELIFWDNCSTDNSSKIFKKFEDKRFKYFLSKKHTVLYEARNLAIEKISGEFIAFLDTDDIWLTNKLEKQIPLFSDHDVGLVYGNCWLYNKKNLFKKKKIFSKKKLSRGMITKSILNDYKVGWLTVMIRKSCLNSTINVFDTNYDLIADFDFAVKFSLKYKFDCIQEPIAIYRRHENQLQRIYFKKQIEQFETWFLKIKSHSYLGSHDSICSIKNKIEYMKIINLIYDKKYFKSLEKIFQHPLNINKFKLILILLLPDLILRYFRDYT